MVTAILDHPQAYQAPPHSQTWNHNRCQQKVTKSFFTVEHGITAVESKKGTKNGWTPNHQPLSVTTMSHRLTVLAS